MKAEEVQKAVTATKTVPAQAKETQKAKERAKETPHKTTPIKATNYCLLLQKVTIKDQNCDYEYNLEKIHVLALKRDEVRLTIYKNMKGRGGKIQNRLIPRPCDVTEAELIQLLDKAIKAHLFSDEFLKYLRNIVNQK